jgi:predicted  nucleic acid-binding Zn-ribbon protein
MTALAARLAEVEAEQHQWWKQCRAAEKRAKVAEAKLAEVEAELASGSFYKEADIDALQARAEAAEAREAKLREELAKASNRLEWCSGILPYEINRDKASAWADEASAALQVKP